jgi:hypothetical protein
MDVRAVSRTDDLQAARDTIPYGVGIPQSAALCLRAIPDLLAVVRAAQAFSQWSGEPQPALRPGLRSKTWVAHPSATSSASEAWLLTRMREALAAFEKGGKP